MNYANVKLGLRVILLLTVALYYTGGNAASKSQCDSVDSLAKSFSSSLGAVKDCSDGWNQWIVSYANGMSATFYWDTRWLKIWKPGGYATPFCYNDRTDQTKNFPSNRASYADCDF